MLALAGCSADIGRFDFPAMGVNSTEPKATGSLPTPPEPLRRSSGLGSPPPPGVLPPPRPGATVSALPDAPPPAGMPYTPARPAIVPPPVVSAAPTPPPVGGTVVDVQPGDTISMIARRNGVSIAALMSANNLTAPNIRAGQKLTIPPGGRKMMAKAPSPVTDAVPAAAPVAPASPAIAPKPAPVVPADWTASYTMQPGDSLYAIARRHKVTALALQQANGIADPTKLRPGMVLKVPVVAAAAPPAAPASPAPISPAPVATSPIASPKPASPEPKRVAALGTVPTTSPVISDASPAPAPASAAPTVSTATPKFRWPVKGRVVAAFGPRPDSTHNDGINIAVPAGAEVVAAEGGMVAYAGNELKGYGNLVLIRHENNWVTAYAHNDEILVKRGDKVKRGQPIARAGRTGADGQPHVHFEVRQGSRPVDPIPYLEGN